MNSPTAHFTKLEAKRGDKEDALYGLEVLPDSDAERRRVSRVVLAANLSHAFERSVEDGAGVGRVQETFGREGETKDIRR